MNIKPAPYYNNPQLALQLSTAPTKVFIGGRGVGKTTIIADEFIKYISVMPRGKIAFGGLTYFHIRTKSMPQIIDQFERRGLYHQIHYFIGKKAPKRWGWNEPFAPPLDYSNCVHFWNGFVVEFISFDRPEMARSGNYDGMVFDEITKLKKEALQSDVMPANRGNNDRFGHIRFHHGFLGLGTMPLTNEGEWVFDYEDLMRKYPSQYLYLEAPATENIKILGEQYFRNLKRTMPQIVYDLEIMNIRRKRNASVFYPQLSDKHCYHDSYDYHYYDSIGYDIKGKAAIDSRGDKDCVKDEPLYMSLDFGSTQNCMVIAQWHKSDNEFPIIKNFFVENETLSVLLNKFIEYYQHHKCKTVFLYGGSDGTRKNDAASRMTYFDDVTEQLTRSGWEVAPRFEVYEASHMDKFIFWNKFLSGDFTNLPAFSINMNNALETFISMDNAPVHTDQFKKDKSSERRTDQPRWKATDLSDAVDNLYFWMFNESFIETVPMNEMAFIGK